MLAANSKIHWFIIYYITAQNCNSFTAERDREIWGTKTLGRMSVIIYGTRGVGRDGN